MNFLSMPGAQFDPRSADIDMSGLQNALALWSQRNHENDIERKTADALTKGYGGLQPMNALSGPSGPMPQQPSYGVQGGARNAMFDMGSLGASTGANALAGPRDDYLTQIKGMETNDPTKPASWDYKQQTNGYGTRAKFPGERLDPQEADARFGNEINKARQIVDQHAPNAPDGWKKALTSLTFNAGADWTKSGLGAAIANGDWEGAKQHFAQYVKAGGQTLPGLQARRQQELGWTNDGALAQTARPAQMAQNGQGFSPEAFAALAGARGTQGLAGDIIKQRYERANPSREEDLSYKSKLNGEQRMEVEQAGNEAAAIANLPEGTARVAAWRLWTTRHDGIHGPGLSPEERDPVTGPQLAMAHAGKILNPDTAIKSKLEIEKTRAEIAKLNHEAAGKNEFGLNPILGQDGEGNTVVMQAGKDGSLVRSRMPAGVTANYGLKSSQQAQGKESGTAQAKALANLPLANAASDRLVNQLDELINDPALGQVTGSVYGRLPEWTNSSGGAKVAQSRINQVLGGTFLQAYSDLKGAGAISNKEGEKAETAYNRLHSQNLDTRDYIAALKEFKQEVLKLSEIAKQRAGGAQAAPQMQNKVLNWHPETGLTEAH